MRVLVLSEDRQQVLLQKSWFSPQLWSVPGGGIAFGETEQAAVIREVREETGITVSPQAIMAIGEFRHAPGVPFTVVAFLAIAPLTKPVRRGLRKLEILDAKWFPLDALPSALSGTAAAILQSANKLANPKA